MTKKNITLPESIRNVIQQYGKEVVKDIRLSNILDDVASFDDIPAAKPVLRTILKAGYGEKLLSDSQELQLKINAYVSDICQSFGYQTPIVHFLLCAIAYGLGKLETVPAYKLEEITPVANKSKAVNNTTNVISDLTGELNAQKKEYLRLLKTRLVIPQKTSAYYPASALTQLSFIEDKIKLLCQALKTNDQNWCHQEMTRVLQSHVKDTSSLKRKAYSSVAAGAAAIVLGGGFGISYICSLNDIERFENTVKAGDNYVASGLYSKAMGNYAEAYMEYDAFNSSSYKEDALKKMEIVTEKLIQLGNTDNSYLQQAKQSVLLELQLDLSVSDKKRLNEKLQRIEITIANRVNNGKNTLILNIAENGGRLNSDGRKLLRELIAMDSDDYWLNFIKNKEK